MTDVSPMPVLFISHGGGPCFFMKGETGLAKELGPHCSTAEFFRRLVDDCLPRRPKAVLVVSAHWEEAIPTVTTSDDRPLLFDYYGFPDYTYKLTWPAKGSERLTSRITDLLSSAGLNIRTDAKRGYDHGVFVPLKLIFPDADIPVVQLSILSSLDPKSHLALGRALAELRQEDVLILGSGALTHNLGIMRTGDSSGGQKMKEFDAKIVEMMLKTGSQRSTALENWKTEFPYARLAHPREDHLLPLHVVVGAAENEPGKVVNSAFAVNDLFSLTCFQFG